LTIHADLRRDDDGVALAALLQPLADHGLGLAPRVALRPDRIDVRGVDEIETRVGERVEQRERRRFVGRPAEDVAAERERRDRQTGTTEGPLLHRTSVCREMRRWYR